MGNWLSPMRDGVAIAESNQVAWAMLRASMPGHRVFDEPFAYWTIPNRPAGVLQATRLRLSLDEDEFDFQLGRMLKSYQDASSPANWILGPSATPADLGKRLRKRRMMGPRYLPGMNADLSKPVEPPALKVDRIDDWSEFDRYEHPLKWFFPKAVKPDVVPLLKTVSDAAPDRVFPLIARIDGVPACSATVFLHEGAIGIYDIVTLPEFRNKGAGSSVVRACLLLGQDLGAKEATLQAYPKATWLYERHGFDVVCRFASLYYSRTRMESDRESQP